MLIVSEKTGVPQVNALSHCLLKEDESMRRKDKAVLDVAAINAKIREADICRLALCDGPIPYIVPMNFGYRDNTLYFHCAKEGRKLDIIRKNNNVCFEIESDVEIIAKDTPCESTAKYFCVIGHGRAEIIEDPKEKISALNAIMAKYSSRSDYEYVREAIDRISIIKVDISEVTGKRSGC